MGMSDKIEAFITELLKDDTNEWLELRRNELANIFGCVPSQINYVISTRFNPERGYIVESRRGGGGYLRIKQISYNELVSQVIELVGNSLDEKTAKSHLTNLIRHKIISEKTASIIYGGIADNVLTIPQPHKDILRANIFKNMLINACN